MSNASEVLQERAPHPALRQVFIRAANFRVCLFQDPEQEVSPPAQVLSAVKGMDVHHRLMAHLGDEDLHLAF